MEFEDVLDEVGSFGRYQQFMIWFFLLPTGMLLPWFTMNIMFMLSTPDHWCFVPEVAASNLTLEEQRRLIGPPEDPKCLMYDVNYTDFLEAGIYMISNDTAKKPCSMGWQYDTTFFDYTASTEWDIVCHNEHYKSLVLTLFNVGSIIFTPIYGAISDKIGRKPAFFITLTVTAISAFASVIVRNFEAFVVLKTINGGLMPSLFQLPYIIILEIVSPEMRTRMNGMANCFWTLGLSFLPLIAYLSRNSITLGIVTSSVLLIYFVYYKFLPESPRWLVSKGKYDEALSVMQIIAKRNKKVQDPSILMTKLMKLGEKMRHDNKEKGKSKVSSKDLFKYKQMRKRFLIVTFCWIADITGYYGLQLNAANLAGNEFLNFFLLTIVEMPGYLYSWVFMEFIGRRWCTVSNFIFTGFACILPAIIPEGLPFADVACSMVGKFFAAASFMSTYQQSSELYPTTMRSIGMGMSSVFAFTVTLAVPYIPYLNVLGHFVPFLVVGLICVVAGFLAMFLPETLHKNLPQTVDDVEVFGLDQKFFGLNRHRKMSHFERTLSFTFKEKVDHISRKLSLRASTADIAIQTVESMYNNLDGKKRESYTPRSDDEVIDEKTFYSGIAPDVGYQGRIANNLPSYLSFVDPMKDDAQSFDKLPTKASAVEKHELRTPKAIVNGQSSDKEKDLDVHVNSVCDSDPNEVNQNVAENDQNVKA